MGTKLEEADSDFTQQYGSHSITPDMNTTPAPYNPYATPEAEVDHTPEGALWREGRLIVVKRGESLPERCVKCNQPAEGSSFRPRLFYYRWPIVIAIVVSAMAAAWLLTIFLVPFGVVVAIAAVAVAPALGRKSTRVEYRLCAVHRRKRLVLGVSALICLIGGFWLFFMGLTGNTGAVSAAGLVVFITAFVLALLRSQPLKLNLMEDKLVYLKGAGEQFLASLPAKAGSGT